MADRVITLGRSAVQHGRDSDRVYLMEMAAGDMPGLLPQLNELAARHGYGKIFVKLPARFVSAFRADGFVTEAVVPGFFGGEEDGHFMGKFLVPGRDEEPRQKEIARTLALARKTAIRSANGRPAPKEYVIRRCTPDDCRRMAALYRAVFPTYPFPVHEPDFLARSMADNVIFYGAWSRDGELAALSSAEQYRHNGHVEMTDFLTVPGHRRQGLAGRLLAAMDREVRRSSIPVAYTIARALSVGMNITFARAGYRHAGTLINNTGICGRIESMQVWYKAM
ncbi:MAG: putative beta-lysine N-acetyltransferase [Thermodesulfobacteriota bacterium]